MTIYIDDMRAEFHGQIMCHMIADHDDELHAMAALIGIARRWHQAPPHHVSHYDVSLPRRLLAVRHGALEISVRDCALMTIRRRREGPAAPLVAPAEGRIYLRAWLRRVSEPAPPHAPPPHRHPGS